MGSGKTADDKAPLDYDKYSFSLLKIKLAECFLTKNFICITRMANCKPLRHVKKLVIIEEELINTPMEGEKITQELPENPFENTRWLQGVCSWYW